MAIPKEEYAVLVKQTAPPSPLGTDCLKAFLCGGGICALAQLGLALLQTAGLDEDTGKTVVMIALIVLTAVLTAFGLFDKLAKHAGAGTAVPITGFANAVVSPALEAKREGFVLGTAAQPPPNEPSPAHRRGAIWGRWHAPTRLSEKRRHNMRVTEEVLQRNNLQIVSSERYGLSRHRAAHDATLPM